MDTKVSFGARVKEFFRKLIVSLKHRPHVIPQVMMVIAFCYFSLHLTTLSDTTAKINVNPMGLCEFISMLLSILVIVCFGNAFPRRKPANKPMLVLMFLMFAAIIWADATYRGIIAAAVNGNPDPQGYINANPYIFDAFRYLQTHIILVCICVALIVLLPVYAKLIRKIKTSIDVEANEDMGAIDIAGED